MIETNMSFITIKREREKNWDEIEWLKVVECIKSWWKLDEK